MSDIKITNVSKSFGDKQIFNKLNLFVKKKSTVALMGASGCGKTTLLRIIAGLEKADGGTVFSDNKISYLFQEDRLCEDFSVISNIKFVLENFNEEKTVEILKNLGLSDISDKKVKELSGGMKRRVAIARALAANYDVLILDEPFKGLDEELKKGIIEYIKDYNKDKTVIMVTHDLDEAKQIKAEILNFSDLT